jgi:hypothetical protein
MRNEILRDVLAGCAGVLAVAAAIGLPTGPVADQQPGHFQLQHAVLLPHFSKVGPSAPAPPQHGSRTGP